MASAAVVQPIVVYQIERHPLEVREPRRPFRWLRSDDGFLRDLEALIGPFNPEDVSVLVDRLPAGPAWKELIRCLLEERLRMVVTHLAPLSPGQRQQLIAVCAQSGTQLITPADAGRRRRAEPIPASF
ncbi:MAG TPA: hypothetical protein VJJ46_09805 [Anaerolineales bacterium]|nr:hypothetical protein [Anaerolineales bacterium]